MDRTQNERIRWKKIGGGTLTLLGSVIKQGDIFKAYPWQIPPSFRDTIIPLDALPTESNPIPEPIRPTYTVMPRGKSKSMFDVVDEKVLVDGKPKRINEAPLSKELAAKLKEDLEK